VGSLGLIESRRWPWQLPRGDLQ